MNCNTTHYRANSSSVPGDPTPLQSVTTSSGMVAAIADALGFHFYSGAPPQEQLINFLRQKQLLLVLDNFEQLLTGAALVTEILSAAPNVKVLVTSREALKLHEEWFHPLAGMRLPPQARRSSPGYADAEAAQASIATYDAVQLFVQTARRALVSFDPEAEQQHIVPICRLVDGMPLGIELAASWLKVLSCEQIAQEIERGVDILVARHQNVPARHRSMRVVLEQSWLLLDAEAQQVLKRLAVLRGGFRQAAAVAVAEANLLILADLVEKSWLYRTPADRYQMHELLRQFAAEQLAIEPHEATATQERHARFYLQQVAQREQALMGAAQRAALDEIGVEIENILAAWLSAVDLRMDQLLDEALQALYRFFQIRSRYAEGEEHFVAALHQVERQMVDNSTGTLAQLRLRLLARVGALRLARGALAEAEADFAVVLQESADPRELAFVYAQSGNGERWRGNRAVAQAALLQSLDLARANGDRNQMAESLLVLADTASAFSEFVQGARYAREALALCRQLQRPDLTAQAVASLAWATNCLGAYAESAGYYRESLAISESIGNPFGIGVATQFLGWVAYCEGGERLGEALSYYQRSITIFRQIGHGNHLAMALGDYALAASELGDYAAAFRSAQEGVAITEALGHLTQIAYNLNGLGAAACGLGDLAASRRYLLRSLQIASDTQTHDHAAVALYLLAGLLVKESELPDLPDDKRLATQKLALELFTVVSEQPITWQLFRERARRAQADLVARLPPTVAAAILEREQPYPLVEAIAQLLNNGLGDSKR